MPRNLNHLAQRNDIFTHHNTRLSRDHCDLLGTVQKQIQRRQPVFPRDFQDGSMIKEITEDTSPSDDGAEGLHPAAEVSSSPDYEPRPKEDEHVDQPNSDETHEGNPHAYVGLSLIAGRQTRT